MFLPSGLDFFYGILVSWISIGKATPNHMECVGLALPWFQFWLWIFSPKNLPPSPIVTGAETSTWVNNLLQPEWSLLPMMKRINVFFFTEAGSGRLQSKDLHQESPATPRQLPPELEGGVSQALAQILKIDLFPKLLSCFGYKVSLKKTCYFCWRPVLIWHI